MHTLKHKVLYADNGILIQDCNSDWAEVKEYEEEGKDKCAPAKRAIGGLIWDIALECLGEEIPDNEWMEGFQMEVKLTPITKKKR